MSAGRSLDAGLAGMGRARRDAEQFAECRFYFTGRIGEACLAPGGDFKPM